MELTDTLNTWRNIPEILRAEWVYTEIIQSNDKATLLLCTFNIILAERYKGSAIIVEISN